MKGRDDAPATLVGVLLQRGRTGTAFDVFRAAVLAAQEAAGEPAVVGRAEPVAPAHRRKPALERVSIDEVVARLQAFVARNPFVRAGQATSATNDRLRTMNSGP